MDISADEAELRSHDSSFHAASRDDASPDSMLATLIIDDVPRPEFG
jgi:hypothetical protein